MRIALCHRRLDQRGGTERDLYLTAQGLRDLGHEIHLFCGEFGIAPPAGTFAHRVPIVPLGRTARLWSFALSAPRMMAAYRCDLVVGFGRLLRQDVLRSGGGCHKLFLEQLGRREGALRRLWQRLSVYHRSLLALERRQFASGGFKQIVAVSERVKREIIAAYGVADEKIVVIHNGVDQERFQPSLRDRWRNSTRHRWGIPADAQVALFVGSGFRRKGLDRLLAIWGGPAWQRVFLLVVGGDARMRRYEAWAAKQAPGRIVFAGRQEQVENFYGAADVVVLPSVQEAFGNVVLEALACGLPVVVSRTVGAAELLTGELANGIVTRPDDLSELDAKLKLMLAKSHDGDLATQARALGMAYSWENHLHRLDDCLSEVSRQSRCGAVS